MGRLGKVLSFFRTTRGDAALSEATVDPGGGANVTVEHFSAPGDDSQPLPGDYALLVPIAGSGRMAAAGYLDPGNTDLAGPGEKRIYSRNSSGDIIAEVWLKSDGSVTVTNASGGFTLAAGGDVTINGVTIDIAGNITTTGAVTAASMVADGKELVDHVHLSADPPANTGPNQ